MGALDNNFVVLDTTSNTVEAVVPRIADANGITFNDSYVFVAEAGGATVAVIAKRSWEVIATVPSGGKSPDAIYWDPRENSVFVANVESNNMEEFSATAPFTVDGALNLSSEPAENGPTWAPTPQRRTESTSPMTITSLSSMQRPGRSRRSSRFH